MTCNETQLKLLEPTDDGTQLPTEVRNHLRDCLACQQFRTELLELNTAWLNASGPSFEPRVQDVMRYIALNETNFRTHTDPEDPRISRRHRKVSWRQTLYHYGIAASLALVLANVGFFTSLSTDLSTADARVVGYLQGAVQYIVHPQF